MMLLWIPLLFVIAFAIYWEMRPGEDTAPWQSAGGRLPAPVPENADPIDIARRRFARGDITAAQYEEIVRTIG